MSASTTTNNTTAQQRVRQLWKTFEQWQGPRRTAMLEPSPQSQSPRSEIESKFYSTSRDEWQKRLAGAGLRDEDWGEMSATETKALERALGPHDHHPASTTASSSNGSEEQPPRDESTSLAVPAPPPMFSSLSTSSIASNFSSYELVNPSDLGSDDEDAGPGFNFFNTVCSAP